MNRKFISDKRPKLMLNVDVIMHAIAYTIKVTQKKSSTEQVVHRLCTGPARCVESVY